MLRPLPLLTTILCAEGYTSIPKGSDSSQYCSAVHTEITASS